jgi:adhesin transport system outer membrane protein
MFRTIFRQDSALPSFRHVLACTALSAALAGCATNGFEGSASCHSLTVPDSPAQCENVETTGSIPDGREKKDVQREAVQSSLLDLATEPATSLARAGATQALRDEPKPEKSGKPAPGRVVRNLPIGEAVAVAVLSHPLMGAQAARIRGSHADLRYADAGNMPQLSAFVGSGHGTTGTYSNVPTQFDHQNIVGTSRTDAGFTFRQLIYDFGSTRLEIERNRALVDQEKYRLAEQAEDIAQRTVNAFLNLLEQGELIRLIDQTVAQQRQLAEVVKLNQQSGNGTKADLDHIQSKVIEIEALRSDIKTNYQTAMDEFNRLTGLRPQQVRRPQASKALVPPTVEKALEKARAANPSIAALGATGVALGLQMDSVKAQRMPKLELQGEGLNKHYIGAKAFSQGVVDVRAMASLSFKIYDGGMLQAQVDRIKANADANAFKVLDERETVELNLRRFYLTVNSSRTKRAAAAQGLKTASSVKALYTEQFKAGKRTIFEVLDSNMLVFTMNRNRINGEFEEMRALYGILRNMGQLCDHFARAGGEGKLPPPKPAEPSLAAYKAVDKQAGKSTEPTSPAPAEPPMPDFTPEDTLAPKMLDPQ